MRVLGIDPGSRITGFGVVDVEGSRLRSLCFGKIDVSREKRLEQRLARLARELGATVEQWRPDVAVLESPFHGTNARSLILLAQARGALLATLGERGLDAHEYTPAQIKQAVTGSGRADKDQVSRMVRLLLGLHEAIPSRDASDALAVAICYAQRRKIDSL